MAILDQAKHNPECLEVVNEKISKETSDFAQPASVVGEVKKIRVQVGVVQRLCKDNSYYIRECEQHLAKIDIMKVCIYL